MTKVSEMIFCRWSVPKRAPWSIRKHVKNRGGEYLEETEALVGRLPPGGHPELECPK